MAASWWMKHHMRRGSRRNHLPKHYMCLRVRFWFAFTATRETGNRSAKTNSETKDEIFPNFLHQTFSPGSTGECFPVGSVCLDIFEHRTEPVLPGRVIPTLERFVCRENTNDSATGPNSLDLFSLASPPPLFHCTHHYINCARAQSSMWHFTSLTLDSTHCPC